MITTNTLDYINDPLIFRFLQHQMQATLITAVIIMHRTVTPDPKTIPAIVAGVHVTIFDPIIELKYQS